MKRLNLKRIIPTRNRWIWVTIYALYIVFILISTTAYFAQQSINSRAIGTHSYNLTFDENGKQDHYIVTLTNSAEPGEISAVYNADTHHLDVTTKNIDELTIDCKSIAEEKSQEIVGRVYTDNENYYKEYFIEKDKFTVTVKADHPLVLTFKDVPFPSKVVVNSNELTEGEGGDYTYLNGEIKTLVLNKEGTYNVDIYFEDSSQNLIASFKTDNRDFYHIPNTNINFDASTSTGEIVDYIWDFGDGKFGYGVTIKHIYSNENNYDVTLIVRDNNDMIKRAYHTVYVYDKDEDGLPDTWEIIYNIQDPQNDEDEDGLSNIDEYFYNTNPKEDDTDGDGFSDGEEIESGTDPLDSDSKPGKKSTEEYTLPTWIIFAIGSVILVILAVLVTRSYIFLAKQKTINREKLRVKKKHKAPAKTKKIKMPMRAMRVRQPMDYVASTIPKEAMGHTAITIKEPITPSKPGSEDVSEYENEEYKKPPTNHDGLYDGLMDNTLGQSLTSLEKKTIYECPYCNSEIGEDDTSCPICKEDFDE